jgi:hypothetical protein
MTDWRPVVGDVRRVHIQACQEPLCREDQGEFWESVGGHYALVPWLEWEQALDLQDSYDELLDDFNNKKAHEGMDCYVSFRTRMMSFSMTSITRRPTRAWIVT